MDSTANSYEAPPGYSEHAGTANAPYGQSRLLHGDENNGPPDKIPTHQPGLDGTPNAPYPPSEFSQYPDPPGYAPYGAMPYGHAMGPGYPPPGYAGAAPPPPLPPQQQQQQSVVVVSGQRHHHPMLIGHVQSYAGHIILACFVTWCCCFIFGIIAFILASKPRRPLRSNQLTTCISDFYIDLSRVYICDICHLQCVAKISALFIFAITKVKITLFQPVWYVCVSSTLQIIQCYRFQ